MIGFWNWKRSLGAKIVFDEIISDQDNKVYLFTSEIPKENLIYWKDIETSIYEHIKKLKTFNFDIFSHC